MADVRAKFVVEKIEKQRWNKEASKVTLSPVTPDASVPENERYHKATPGGSMELFIDNPPAAAAFNLGDEFYVDFTRCKAG